MKYMGSKVHKQADSTPHMYHIHLLSFLYSPELSSACAYMFLLSNVTSCTIPTQRVLWHTVGTFTYSASANWLFISVHVACAGAIELAILSEHFRLEFAVVDVQTLRVDRFGEQFPSSYAHMVVCDACLQMGSVVEKFLSIGL